MKLLITGAITWSEEQIKELENFGNEVIYIQDERIPLKEQGIDETSIEGTICNGLFLYNNIKDLKNLKYIQLTSAGFDRVPIDYIREYHIEIYNAKGVYSIPMAEFVICGVLQLYKQSRFFYENQKMHHWEKDRGIIELFGKTVCIIGCGDIGTECAKRFQAFGCRIIGINRHSRKDVNYEKIFEMEQLDIILQESDIVVLTLPLTNETKYLMDKKRLQMMKQGAILVNVARGNIIKTEALIDEMTHLGGAVLDVFEEEPLSESSLLWGMKNVIITPHNSFVGRENRERLQRVIIENIKKKTI